MEWIITLCFVGVICLTFVLNYKVEKYREYATEEKRICETNLARSFERANDAIKEAQSKTEYDLATLISRIGPKEPVLCEDCLNFEDGHCLRARSDNRIKRSYMLSGDVRDDKFMCWNGWWFEPKD